MKPPILITGCARSGTSLTAGVVDICGAFGGSLRPGGTPNPKGMFENNEIIQDIIKPYLDSIGMDKMGQDPLPKLEDLVPYPKLKEKVENVMMGDGYECGPWYFKGAKTCLIWPLWHKAFPKAKWIIVRRDALSIARSCMNTSFMRAFSNVEGWLDWVKLHETRFNEMHKAGLDIKEIWPEEAIQGNLSWLQMLIEELGLDWKDKEVKEFITPEYWHYDLS